MANSAVLKPMPIVREATATRVNPGLFRSHRSAKRMSAKRDSTKCEDYNPRMNRLLHALLASMVAAVVVNTQAQTPARGFTLEQVLNYPFPDNLVASPKDSTIAWTFNERGAHAEHLKIVAGHDLAHREARPVVEVQRREHRAVTDETVEHFVVRLQVEIVRI